MGRVDDLTKEEQIANAEKAVAAKVKEYKLSETAKLIAIPGHPLQTFTRENEALEEVIKRCREALESGHGA